MTIDYGRVPFSFEANQGQIDETVKFLSRNRNYTLFLKADEAVLALRFPEGPVVLNSGSTVRHGAERETAVEVLRMQFIGANRTPKVAGVNQLPGKSNYLIGNNPSKWHIDIPHYTKVKYNDVYPGIDLVYYGKQRQLEYDFIVTPGADPKDIILGFEGAAKVEIDSADDLILHIGNRKITLQRPIIYQETDNGRQKIQGSFEQKGPNRIGFKIAGYDLQKPLIIDPVLIYSTFLGGGGTDEAYDLAVDAGGNVWITGFSSSFPTTPGSFQPSLNGGGDVFVARLNPAGSKLIYATYVGGTATDRGNAIAVDRNGNACVTGLTHSTDFPGAQNSLQEPYDAFVFKLNAQGNGLIYSRYLGGGRNGIFGGEEEGHGIAVDVQGYAYVTGDTNSKDFPTTPEAFQTTKAGGDGIADAFVTKLSDSGSLLYSTYIGHVDSETGGAIAVDQWGSAYITGSTSSRSFPVTAGVIQPVFPNHLTGFLTKLNSAGSALVYSTFIGTSFSMGKAIAVDPVGNAYVGGFLLGITKINYNATAEVYSKQIVGYSGQIESIALDAVGNAYVVGHTTSTIQTVDPIIPDFGGGECPKIYNTCPDAFVAKLNPMGTEFLFASYLGGAGYNSFDEGYGIGVDARRNIYVTGITSSENFPIVNALQPILGGVGYSGYYPPDDAFVTKIGAVGPTGSSLPCKPDLSELLVTGSSQTHFANQKKADNVLSPVANAYKRLPLTFEVNQGQVNSQVDFMAHGSGYALFIKNNEAALVFTGRAGSPVRTGNAVLRMQLLDTNPAARAQGINELTSRSNYLLGNNPEQWNTDIKNYAKIRYREIYPGVDLIYYGKQRQLEFDFVLAPGADPSVIAIRFQGGENSYIDEAGNLIVNIKGGTVKFKAPKTYQEIEGSKQLLQGYYIAKNIDQYGFQVDIYDVAHTLIIDPVVDYSSYLGGTNGDVGFDIAVDSTGNAYITGRTASFDFPAENSYQAWPQDSTFNAFVTKFNTAGNALVYSTYLGGTSEDEGFGIAVDSEGNAYVTGKTNSGDFPVVNAYQEWAPSIGWADDAFVTKLNASGNNAVYSTFLGGFKDDVGFGIAVDTSGSAYVTGRTYSDDFPTVNPYQAWPSDTTANGFITKLNATGDTAVYSTYLGGTSEDVSCDIAVDASGNTYITGSTSSADFPTVTPFQTWPQDSASNAYVTKLNPAGNAAVYSTYLGGTNEDEGFAIAVDPLGSAYVTGRTTSSDFPTLKSYQAWPQDSAANGFVTKFNAAGDAAVYSTYLGGTSEDIGADISVDSSGNVYVTGGTTSSDFPLKDENQSWPGDSVSNGFVVKLKADGNDAVYSTYLGGTNEDEGLGISIDNDGNAYITGRTNSFDFPTLRLYQPWPQDSFDNAFLVKLNNKDAERDSFLLLLIPTIVSSIQKKR